MRKKLILVFLYSAGAFLLTTASAKLVSSFGSSRILQNSDPVLLLSFRNIFRIVGAIELVVAAVCFAGRSFHLRAWLVAWLTTAMVAYRACLWRVGYTKPCPCPGNLTDAVHISPKLADTAMKIILAYLLIGSYATLLWLGRQKSQVSPSATSS